MKIKKRVLIVEDDALLAMGVEDMVTRFGYHALSPVATGAEAVATAQAMRPDLVLMDINLADQMTGINAAERIQTFADIPIIYLSGHSGDPMLEQAKLTRPYGYLVKPVTEVELKACLEMALYRHSMDKKLHQSEERYRSIVENINDALIIHDFENKILDTNENACLMLGYGRKELVGSNLELFLRPDNVSHYHEQMAALRDSSGIVFETECAHRDGTVLALEVSAKIVSDELGGFVQCFGRDISERRKHQEEIKQKNRELQEIIAAKDKFFSIISHDLKSPLSGFMILTRMLSEEFSTLPLKDLREMARQLAHSTENIVSLLENLLEWSLHQQGVMAYEPVSLPLTDLVQRNIDLFQTLARDKKITLASNVPTRLKIQADKLMLDTIIRNLLSNAIKFSMSGGKGNISAVCKNGQVTLAVQDNGMGICSEAVKELFVMNQKSSRLGTDGELGTGLGLLLCKEFAQQHGGKIWVESALGIGSTFFVSLPVDPCPVAE
ncbi:hybrid sensor histidine kinase/response regulator [Desulfonatronum thiosulfatophilum]|nr:ATP-binding protein [Desulfonatronum thiosulfatophilum]